MNRVSGYNAIVATRESSWSAGILTASWAAGSCGWRANRLALPGKSSATVHKNAARYFGSCRLQPVRKTIGFMSNLSMLLASSDFSSSLALLHICRFPAMDFSSFLIKKFVRNFSCGPTRSKGPLLRKVIFERKLDAEIVGLETIKEVLPPTPDELSAYQCVLDRVEEQVGRSVMATAKGVG